MSTTRVSDSKFVYWYFDHLLVTEANFMRCIYFPGGTYGSKNLNRFGEWLALHRYDNSANTQLAGIYPNMSGRVLLARITLQ